MHSPMQPLLWSSVLPGNSSLRAYPANTIHVRPNMHALPQLLRRNAAAPVARPWAWALLEEKLAPWTPHQLTRQLSDVYIW